MEHMKQCAKKAKLEHIQNIKEGKAEILLTEKNVFYNPVQEFNRDLSVVVLSLFVKEKQQITIQENNENQAPKVEVYNNKSHVIEDRIRILEALSATGLRSIRYAKEITGIGEIVANDISARAVESIKKNIQHNGVEDLVKASHEDATMLMYKNRKIRFHAIDLDPYGCPSIFLDAAVQSIYDDGLLLVTATDMAVLAGNSPETCYVKYGAISLKSKACHEIALRILLQNIASHAARYGRYIVPLLSISADFYIRVFVKLFSSQLKCKENASKMGMLYQCTGCESFHVQPLCAKKPSGIHKPQTPIVDQFCKYCKHKYHIGGPIWIDLLHDQDFVSRLLNSVDHLEVATSKRIKGILTMVQEEIDAPLYYTLDRLMSTVKCHTPPMMSFRSALLNAGYKVSYSHANKISVKTNAPNDVIWDIVRAWEKKHPVKREKLSPDSAALAILTTPSTTNVSFNNHVLANPFSRRMQLSRFQENPSENWGPGTRSKIMLNVQQTESKRVKNQNKKSKRQNTENTECAKNTENSECTSGKSIVEEEKDKQSNF